MGVLLHLGPQGAHGELIVVRDLDRLDVGLLHELLLACEDLPEEIFGDDGLVGQVVLDYREMSQRSARDLRCWSR